MNSFDSKWVSLISVLSEFCHTRFGPVSLNESKGKMPGLARHDTTLLIENLFLNQTGLLLFDRFSTRLIR